MLAVGMYKTRDGRDVKIVAIQDLVAIGYLVEEGVDRITTWRASDGRFIYCDDEDCKDTIDDKPRIKFERYATIGRCDEIGGFVIGLHPTLESARLGAECIAIARIEIDCVEGENLD